MIMQPLRQHHLLMVRFQPGTSPHIAIPVTKGIILRVDASYIDAHTGKKIGETRLHLTGPQYLRFMASRKEVFRGWWYMMEYDRKARVYRCSCLEHRQTGFCSHVEQMSPEFVVA